MLQKRITFDTPFLFPRSEKYLQTGEEKFPFSATLGVIGVAGLGETWQILVWAVVLPTSEGGFIDFESCKLSWCKDDKPLTLENKNKNY